MNRGADYVEHLVQAPCARTRCSTGHREPHNQTAFACAAPGAGQHRDYASELTDKTNVIDELDNYF